MITSARSLLSLSASALTVRSATSTLLVLSALALTTGCASVPSADEGTQTASAPRVVERDLSGAPRTERRPRSAP